MPESAEEIAPAQPVPLSAVVMRIAPLLPTACGMIVGIACDYLHCTNPWISASILVAATVAVSLRSLRSAAGPLAIFVAAAAIGSLLHHRAEHVIPARRIERDLIEPRTIARIRGTVVSEPYVREERDSPFRAWTHLPAQTVFLIDLDSVERTDGWRPAGGRIRVTIGEAVLDLREGEGVELFGWLRSLQPHANPGSFDWKKYYRRDGIVARLHCDLRENITRLPSGNEGWTRRMVRYARRTAAGWLTEDLVTGGAEDEGLLEAMVLGHRSRFDRRLNEIFIQAGCIHFLAASGINVVIVMFLARIVIGPIPMGRRTRVLVMAAAVATYAVLTEPRPPILRATVFALTYCAAVWLGRGRARLNWIAATVMVLAILDPAMIFDVGYQLSTAAVIGVSYVGPAIRQAVSEMWVMVECGVFRRPHAADDRALRRTLLSQQIETSRFKLNVVQVMRRMKGSLVEALTTALGAWIVGVPIACFVFQRFQPWGALGSLIVLPLMTLLMGLGFAKFALQAFAPTAAGGLGTILSVLNALTIRLVSWLSELPAASVDVTTPPMGFLGVFYLCILFFVLRFSQPKANPRARNVADAPHRGGGADRWNRPFAVSAALLVLGVIVWHHPKGGDGRLRATVLSVGRGSATILQLPDGSCVLYDAGGGWSSDVGENVILPFLRNAGVRRIDRVYISHPNLDHFSGVPTLIEKFRVGPIVFNSCFAEKSPERSPGRHLLGILGERDHPLEIFGDGGATWEFGGATFELLWPVGECDAAQSANDASSVIRISYKGRSMLMTGDIEAVAQLRLVNRGDLHADVLLLPHHGGVESTTRDFIRAVGPAVAIRSSHERTEDTLSGIEELVGEARYLNTADVGAVVMEFGEGGLSVFTPCRQPTASDKVP